MAASKSQSQAHSVGKAIRDIRLALIATDGAYTQEHVAHEARVSLRHYQKIEAGTVDVRLSTLFEISDVLKKKPQQMLDHADEMQHSSGSKVSRKR